MATKALLTYATKIFNECDLKKERVIGKIDRYESFDIALFSDLIDLDKYDYDIIEKINSADNGFSMGWHIDGAKVIKNKKGGIIKPNHIKLGVTLYSIYYYIKKPVYTLLVYESNHDIDFTGGMLEFIDGTIVKPEKGMYVFFNSNEAHRVIKMTSGTRKNYLIKFYRK